MNWAWKQKLGPTIKLVLMALADYADEHGECFPSVETLAEKCSVNKRTVQRVLRDLETDLYLNIIPRFVGGFQVSSRYKLNLQQGSDNLSFLKGTKNPNRSDKLSPRYKARQVRVKPAMDAIPGVTLGGDKGVTQTTNSILCINHQLLQFLKPSEKLEIERSLIGVPDEDAAWLVFELVGIQKVNGVRNAVGLMKRLIDRYSIGEFIPALGIAIAEQLKREEDAKSAIKLDSKKPKSGGWNSTEKNLEQLEKLKQTYPVLFNRREAR